MGRFFTLFILFLVIGGLLLHYKVDLPYVLSWIGKLPGDLIAKKGKTIFYFPITSAALTSLVITIILSAFRRKDKN
ncbi:MAG: DUF2905 domain-containing protein [Parachlamydiales bacterium]|nr:DUF2905 domain-containing protein [Parachlamydiales bacterium]